MTSYEEKALLPAGLRDDLPPEAEREAQVIHDLMAAFAAYGYDRVKPPLIEFEESLLAGPGAAVSPQTFRLMDPVSQRMMGLRADMTPQIARIATTRLAHAPRPLRLSYAGQVLRVKGGQLRPERQFAQAGAELIGASGVAAEAEVVHLAAEAMRTLGVGTLSVDFCLPTLVPELSKAFGFHRRRADEVRQALDAKDAGAVAAISGRAGKVFAGLLAAAGPADRCLDRLDALDLPAAGAEMCRGLRALIEFVRAAEPGLSLTVDPGEYRGFEYQSGVSFTFFAKGVRGELGRGGRYRLDGDEAAVGFTIYLDSLMRALPGPERARRIYLPYGTAPEEAQALRRKGWRTIGGLAPNDEPEAAARRLGCTHVLAASGPRKLG